MALTLKGKFPKLDTKMVHVPWSPQTYTTVTNIATLVSSNEDLGSGSGTVYVYRLH